MIKILLLGIVAVVLVLGIGVEKEAYDKRGDSYKAGQEIKKIWLVKECIAKHAINAITTEDSKEEREVRSRACVDRKQMIAFLEYKREKERTKELMLRYLNK